MYIRKWRLPFASAVDNPGCGNAIAAPTRIAHEQRETAVLASWPAVLRASGPSETSPAHESERVALAV